MQHFLQPLVARGVVGSLHGLLILAEELGTFALRKTLKDHLWIARIFLTDRPSRHGPKSTRTN